MNNYKLTLNLPETKFPMRGNLVNREPEILTRWINEDLYNVIRAAKKGKKTFILHDGPPYANGNIHVGHSVNKILKDIIIKSKGLTGFNVPYIPGWDCHGLPIELKVEKKYGKPGENLTAIEFRERCREYAANQVDRQRKDFIRLGILGDWSNPYLTMDFKIEANIIRTLGKIINNGYLYRGIKPVHWCMDCRSSLSEAEVEYFYITSPSIYVTFEAVHQDAIKSKFSVSSVTGSISLLIWTTTPWSLPSSRAISLSMEREYVLVQLRNRAIILAGNLVKGIMKRINISNYKVLSMVKGRELESMHFRHPFLCFKVPVILSDHVEYETGTGAVHIAGGHGLEDYNLSQRYNLEIVNMIGDDGKYIPGMCPFLDGIDIFKANHIITSMLRSQGKILYLEEIQHSYPCCWRHKTPTIFRTTPQWFINLNQKRFRERLLRAIKDVRWIPNWGQSHIESMVENRPDWCISRQRTWGVPMSLFIHKKTQELHPRTLEIIEEVAKRVEVDGIEAWWSLDPRDLIGDDADSYEKILDTLDVWFDSGSIHVSANKICSKLSSHVSDVCLEGSDQYRGWFMSSLIISSAIKGRIPYRQVITHGFSVDSQGRKMSKSIGNVLSPQKVINKLGADILRLWVASTDYTREIAISNEILKRVADSYRRNRNTIRFLLANLNGFDPEKDIVDPEEMVILDRWAVDCTKSAQEDIINAYASYDFHAVVKRLMRFCSVEMGSFYFEIIKDRQYTSKSSSIAHRSCQTALYHIVEAMVRWIAPIMSFTADEVWSYLPGKREKYVFVSEWYMGLFSLSKTGLMNNAFWNELLKIRGEVNKVIEQARTKKEISCSLETGVILYTESSLSEKLQMLGKELKFVLLTSSAQVKEYFDAPVNAWESNLIKGLKIELSKINGKKCARCWNYTNDIGQIREFADICKRCISNIVGKGEERKFV